MFFVHDGGQTSISIHALRKEGDSWRWCLFRPG